THPDAQGNPFTDWSRVVAIDPLHDAVADGTTHDINFGGQNFANARVRPLSSLYHFRLDTQEQVDAVNDMHALNGDPATQWSVERAGRIGDYVALIAFHYTTKEIPDWVWSTFWWHDAPNAGAFAAGRPTDVTGVWRNYLMDVAMSADTPREADGSANIVY